MNARGGRTEAQTRLGALSGDGGLGPPTRESPDDLSLADSGLARLGQIVQRELLRRMTEASELGGEMDVLEQRA